MPTPKPILPRRHHRRRQLSPSGATGRASSACPTARSSRICDVHEARARQLAGELGIPNVYSDYKKMLAEQQPDIVVVATPNIFHKPMTEAALEAGAMSV